MWVLFKKGRSGTLFDDVISYVYKPPFSPLQTSFFLHRMISSTASYWKDFLGLPWFLGKAFFFNQDYPHFTLHHTSAQHFVGRLTQTWRCDNWGWHQIRLNCSIWTKNSHHRLPACRATLNIHFQILFLRQARLRVMIQIHTLGTAFLD